MSNLNLNKVVLAGRLTADPELKLTVNGISVVSGSIAINRPARVENNQKVTEVDYINFVVWRKTAEFIAKYFKKGSAICVTGFMQSRTWEDNGVKHYATEVVIHEVMFVDSLSKTSTTSQNDSAAMEELKDDEELPI